ncbi:hypothetical protein GCM10022221_67990 [Actinocorallia aurea]
MNIIRVPYSFAADVAHGRYVLADPEESRLARWQVPVYLSAAAHSSYVAWSPDDFAETGAFLDEPGRLWELLKAAHTALDAAEKAQGGAAPFALDVVLPGGGYGYGPTRLTAYLCRTRDDEGAPIAKVFTAADW